jgi:hypothetical protein
MWKEAVMTCFDVLSVLYIEMLRNTDANTLMINKFRLGFSNLFISTAPTRKFSVSGA